MGLTQVQAVQVRALLDLIAWSEGTSTSAVTRCDGYDVLVSGVNGPERFGDFAEHPFEARRPQLVRRSKDGKAPLYSTAAGRYQVLLRIWQAYRTMLQLHDFSPASQDAVAVQQLTETRSLQALYSGDVAGALQRANRIWASLPGNGYGQGGHTMPALLERWQVLQQRAGVA